ncbi:hypothetical protein [Mycobacterium kansasii]|uniref:hypothetical protein n=1 Tax=Mycobacterium kansasii TaxID=1768 RepID=UPI003B984BC9
MPQLSDFARDLTGLTGDDPDDAKYLVRVVVALMYWPGEDDDAERRLVDKFVAPMFA